MKTTEWFPGHIKPAYPGVYQLLCGNDTEVGYQKWDGEKWGIWYENAQDAAEGHAYADPEFQNDQWRGLAEQPKTNFEETS